jgi:hypothetical protein
MQRWIAIGVLLVMLGCGGGAFAYWNHKQNLPAPMWVPLPIRNDLPEDELKKTITELRDKLHDEDLLLKAAKDLGLAGKWKMESDGEAQRELADRIFVKIGDMDSPMGKVPAVHIGVTGKKRERQLSGEIAMRLMEDVWKILGIEPPQKG